MTDDHPMHGDLPTARAAKERFGDQLLANPDVHGVGVGRRRRGPRGEKTDEYAVVVHVRRKLPRDRVPAAHLIPSELRFVTPDGREVVVPVDVQERAIPTQEIARSSSDVDVHGRVRPVPGGVSAGGAGTLGGWVWDTVTDQVVALSNRHVFGSIPGAGVSQPSTEDGGLLSADRIASVLRSGSLDAAVALPVDPSIVARSIVGGGPAVFEIADAAVDMWIQKTGRTTGLTRGVVDLIDYDSGHSGSRSDLWIDGDGADFSDAGDSGSLYMRSEALDDRGELRPIVGLHWGGSQNDGVGHHIRAVFDDLGLTTLAAVDLPVHRG
jgi:hypothetical protein